MIYKYLGQIPIRTIDHNNKHDKTLHDQIVALVDRMLDMNKRLNDTKTPHERELLERQIGFTDSEINSLVYRLYNLTEDEIRIVEGER